MRPGWPPRCAGMSGPTCSRHHLRASRVRRPLWRRLRPSRPGRPPRRAFRRSTRNTPKRGARRRPPACCWGRIDDAPDAARRSPRRPVDAMAQAPCGLGRSPGSRVDAFPRPSRKPRSQWPVEGCSPLTVAGAAADLEDFRTAFPVCSNERPSIRHLRGRAPLLSMRRSGSGGWSPPREAAAIKQNLPPGAVVGLSGGIDSPVAGQ